MAEKMTAESSASQPAKLDMDVRVYPSTSEGNPLAYASVTLGGCFAVNGIRIMNGEKGAFVAMPDRKDSKGEYHEVCFPTTAEMRKALNAAVMGEYHRVVDLIAAKGETARPSVRDALKNATKATAARPAPEKAAQTRSADKGAR